MQNKWIGALLVAACMSFPASAQTLRMAIADDATTLDPHSANILGNTRIIGDGPRLFETLASTATYKQKCLKLPVNKRLWT
jgi:hypothetical protein